ncbi:MAG: ATP-binding protein [Candidatus Heimdallarchaeota archaeon]|nr:MAG: ATP-binding protein [Candidatus Heimdallarchaeota archaeon]
MSSYDNFLKPCEPHLVVGRRSHEKRFESILADFKKEKLKENFILISGSPGIGKTSLLNVFGEIVKNEMMVFVSIPIGMGGKMTRNLFRDIYQALSPHLTEEKKGFLKKAKEEEIKSFTLKSKMSDIISGYSNNLTHRPPKSSIVIALDSLDRILDSGQKYVIDGLCALLKVLQSRFPQLLFIGTCQEYNLDEIKELVQISEHFALDKLDFSDSKLLLTKIAHGILRSSSQLREELVKQSDRSPFSLVFIVDVVRWVEDKIKQEGLDESERSIKEMAQPFIRTFALRAFLQEVYRIDEEENKVLQLMLGSSRNAIPQEAFESAKIPKSTRDSLVAKGLIIKIGDFYQFGSYAAFSSLGSGLSVIDLKAEAGLLLQVLEADMMMGFEMNPKVLERLEQASYSTEQKLEDKSIPNRTKSLYQSAFETQKFFEAYRLAILTGNFLRMAKDVEGSGVFFEETAREFYNQEKLPYSTALYRKALEAYRFVKNERKRKDISQRAAMVYLQNAEKYDKQQQFELARASYYHAFKLFEGADDINSATDAVNKAIKTYTSDAEASFFKSLLAGTTVKSVPSPETNT